MIAVDRQAVVALSIVALGVGAFASVAIATNAWGNYHWGRTANPFTLKLGDNVSSGWDASLSLASNDWSQSNVLDTSVVAGGTNPKNCRAVSGRVEVCNNKYGNNGWLGIASIWTSGSHITKGSVRLNDTYFNTAKYNTPSWRNMVMCQEVGHTLGLDHQDENFNNPPLGTCMDYTSDPAPNQHPNLHDYDMLEEMYAHLDTVTTVGQTNAKGRAKRDDDDRPEAWGKEIRQSSDGRTSLYVRDLAQGEKVFTFVTWAQE